ncbi:MAG: acetate--CoA ligase family protein [Actinomycetota bacterium]
MSAASFRSPLERMLGAHSVAVIGASARAGTAGHQTLLELRKGGFAGAVYPVNPKYEELQERRCYPSIAEVPEAVDLAVISLANPLLEETLRACARAGVGSAVIYASGFEEPREGVPPLTERLAAIARGAKMAICGGNCMGFVNVERGLRATGWYEPERLVPGPIAFISHSGSAFAALLHNARGLRFNVAISSGQEFVTTTVDYMRYALGLESTRAIGLFIETIRDPSGFREVMALANEADVPVVALKVGREALTRELVTSHSGALAGEDGAYEALFRADGVHRVETLDEMGDTLALFVAGRRAGPGGLASVHDSGGERAMLVDAAAAAGVPLASIAQKTSDRMAELLEPGLPPVNPLDFWGTGRDAYAVITGCERALLEDPGVAALAFAADLTTEDDPEEGYIASFLEVWPETDKPMAMLSNFAGGISRLDAERLYGAGAPVLEGTLTGLAAFRHLFDHRDHRALPAVDAASPIEESVRERWRARLVTGEDFTEAEGLRLLADYGVRTVAARTAESLDDVLAAAEGIWPVALKTAAPGITHKTEADGVRLHLLTEDQLRAEYVDLSARLGPRVTVAAMAPEGVEIHIGVVRDEQFGPLVLVAAGGVLVEVLKDRRLALPPLDEARARRLVDGLAVRPLLDGVRGRPPADIDALLRAVVAMSWLAHDLGDHLEALDVNPVMCGPAGCLAVDALVIPRADARPIDRVRR